MHVKNCCHWKINKNATNKLIGGLTKFKIDTMIFYYEYKTTVFISF